MARGSVGSRTAGLVDSRSRAGPPGTRWLVLPTSRDGKKLFAPPRWPRLGAGDFVKGKGQQTACRNLWHGDCFVFPNWVPLSEQQLGGGGSCQRRFWWWTTTGESAPPFLN